MKIKLLMALTVGFMLLASQAFSYQILSGSGLNEIFFQNYELLFDGQGNQLDLTDPEDVARGLLPGDTFVGIINAQNVDVDSSPFWQFDSIPPDAINVSGVFAQEVVEVLDIGEDFSLVILTNPSQFSFTLLDSTTLDISGILNAGEMIAFYVDTDADGTFTAFNSNGTIQQDVADATDSDSGDVWMTAGVVAGDWPDYTSLDIVDYAYSFPTLGVPLGEFSAEAYAGLSLIRNNTGFAIFDLVNDAGEDLVDTFVQIAFTSEIEENNNFPGSSPWQVASNDPAIMRPVPEPSTLLLLGAGLLGLGYFVRKRRS